MPNFVSNIIRIKNLKDVNKTINKITNNKGYFSFENIIPQPSNIYKGDLGEKEIQKYGKDNWYNFNLSNWGTKWDCSESVIIKRKDYIVIKFQTAWNCPLLVIDKILEMVKTDMIVEYADEAMGENCGLIIYKFKNNKVNKRYIDMEGDYDFARRLWNA